MTAVKQLLDDGDDSTVAAEDSGDLERQTNPFSRLSVSGSSVHADDLDERQGQSNPFSRFTRTLNRRQSARTCRSFTTGDDLGERNRQNNRFNRRVSRSFNAGNIGEINRLISPLSRFGSVSASGSIHADDLGERERKVNPFNRRESASACGSAVAADDAGEINKQANPFSRPGSIPADDLGERHRQSNPFNCRETVCNNRSFNAGDAGEINKRIDPLSRLGSVSASGSIPADDLGERHRQTNPFNGYESASTSRSVGADDDADEINRRVDICDRREPTIGGGSFTSAEDFAEINNHVNPFSRLGSVSAGGSSVAAGDTGGEQFRRANPFSPPRRPAPDPPAGVPDPPERDGDELNNRQENPCDRVRAIGTSRCVTPDNFVERRRGRQVDRSASPGLLSSSNTRPNTGSDLRGSAKSSLRGSTSTVRSSLRGSSTAGSITADDTDEQSRQMNPFSAPTRGLSTVEDASEKSVVEHGDTHGGGAAYDTLHKNDALGDEESNSTDSDCDGVDETDQQSRTKSPRKKVKNRHCKAAIMACVVWSITVTLISLALGMDLFSEELYSLDDEDLCSLCGDNGLDSLFGNTTTLPTQQPSSSDARSRLKTIDPPPANLAEVCAPSIRLHHVSHLDGLLTGDLTEKCFKACQPSMCCLVNNEKVQEDLLSMLGLGGLDDNQALEYLSTMKDCYEGDAVPVCEAYNEWCATLYSLDFVLEKSLPSHFFETCHRNQEDEEDVIITSSRVYSKSVKSDDDCEKVCRPLECCYGNQYESSHIMRKRDRQHKPHEDGETYFQIESRRRVEEGKCQHFNAYEPLNTQLCDAYSPFCSPYDNKLDFTLSFPKPTGAPTQTPPTSLNPTIHPSSSTAPSTSLDPSVVPSSSASPSNFLDSILRPPGTEDSTTHISLIFTVPTRKPTTIPTPNSSFEQTISIPPSNENDSPSFTSDPTVSSVLNPPSFQPSTIDFSSLTSDTNQSTDNLLATSTPSTLSSAENNFPTQQPSSSEVSTGARNATLNQSLSLSEQPSVSSSSNANAPSMEPR